MATDLETNKATVRQFFGAVERRDFKVFDQIVVENYAHNIQDMPIGRESLKSYFSGLCGAVPDLTNADPGSHFRRRHRHGEEPGPRHAPRRLRSTEGDWKDIRYRCIPPLPPEGGPIGRALRGGGYGGAASASAQLKPMVVHIDFALAAEAGEGAPVVLLHGFPETSYAWRYQIEALKTRDRLIVPDLRGA